MSVAMRSSSGVVSGLAGEGVAGQHAADGRRADEPRPRASGIRCASTIRQPTPSGRSPRAARRVASRPRTKRLSWSAVSSPLALAVDGQLDLAPAPAPDLEVDPCWSCARASPETVVAGAEVGRRGRHLDGDPAARRARRANVRPSSAPLPAERHGDRADGRRASRKAADLALGSARILEAVPGQHAHDGAVGLELAGRRGLGHAGHAGRRGRLAEDALVAGEGRGRPRGSRRRSRRDPAARLVTGVDRRLAHDAGLPIRMAVATVSGCSIRWPTTIGRRAGGLEAPHPGPRRHDAGGRVLAEAGPVGGDVARVADRDGEHVGRPAEVVADLEGGGLLALEAERVDRVDQGDRVVVLLGQRADDRRAPGRSCRRWRRPARPRSAPGAACRAAIWPFGSTTMTSSPAAAP